MSNAIRPAPAPGAETPASSGGWAARKPTALLVLADGRILEGFGVGATGAAVGEVCFNTAMTGYEEILTDPSYAGQIITFTFPHIGVVGTNEEDIETANLAASAGARGAIFRADVAEPSNFRATRRLDAWLKSRGIIGLTGIDTRALTATIRREGMPNAVIAHDPTGEFDREALLAQAKAWPGIDGMDLVPVGHFVAALRLGPDELAARSRLWAAREREFSRRRDRLWREEQHSRLLSDCGCAVTVVPATTPAGEILALKPDGVFLSNGPGDPAETGKYAVPIIKDLLQSGIADLRHLPRAPDARPRGRRAHDQDAAGPSRREPSGDGLHDRQGRDRVDEPRLRDRPGDPARQCSRHPCLAVRRLELRHRATDRPAFSVQHHPEASPGPRDSHYLFRRFVEEMAKAKAKAA